MWGSFNIIKKIWFSLSILVLAYLASMIFGFFFGLQTEKRLQYVSDDLFSAATQSQLAETSFKQQVKDYYDAVTIGELSFVEAAETKFTHVQEALKTISRLEGLPGEKKSQARMLLRDVSAYADQAEKVYPAVIQRYANKFSRSPSDDALIFDQVVRLNSLASNLEKRLSDFAGNFAADMRQELSFISRSTQKSRYMNGTVFIITVFTSLSLVAFIIQRYVSRPLKNTFMLENAVTQSIDGIAVVDLEGRVEFCNTAWGRMHDYSVKEAVGKPITDFYTDERRRADGDLFFEKLKTTGFHAGETDQITKNGEVFPAFLTSNLIKSADNRPANYVFLARDLTSQKKTELEHFIASTSSIFFNRSGSDIQDGIMEALRLLFDFLKPMRCAVLQSSDNDTRLSITHECYEPGLRPIHEKWRHMSKETLAVGIFNRDADENIFLVNVDDLSPAREDLKKVLKREGAQSLLLGQMVHQDSLIGLIYLISPMRVQDWPPSHRNLIKTVSEILANVCARQRAEEEILMYQEKLRKASTELLLTEERERRRIASEIHDRIGHALANVKIRIGMLNQALPMDHLRDDVEQIRLLINQTIQDTRTLTFELSPPILYELGLKAAIDWLAEQVRKQHQLQIDLIDDGKPETLDNTSRIFIFQAIRELLFNVIKHAAARRIEVSLSSDEDQIIVRIVDDGIGFDPNSISRSEGFGLFSIRERINQLSGRFTIESGPGRGTQIYIQCPVKPAGTPRAMSSE